MLNKSESLYSSNTSNIGKIAFDWLMQSKEAVVWGVTSGGIFLHLKDKKIIFLTKENHFGPVNLINPNGFPQSWKSEVIIQILVKDHHLTLSTSNTKVEFDNLQIWSTPAAPNFQITIPEQDQRMLQAARQLSLLKDDQGFAPLLIPFLKHEERSFPENPWLQKSWENIQKIRQALTEQDAEKVIESATTLVGSGRGLTPSGDDLLTGLFFMINRWFKNAEWIQSIQPALLNQFQKNTTAVSSTLFYCGIQGEVDARIQEMSDGLMNPTIPFSHQAIELSRWGNSSGADIFQGILLAIEAFRNTKEDST
jgi:hypothetical protein